MVAGFLKQQPALAAAGCESQRFALNVLMHCSTASRVVALTLNTAPSAMWFSNKGHVRYSTGTSAAGLDRRPGDRPPCGGRRRTERLAARSGPSAEADERGGTRSRQNPATGAATAAAIGSAHVITCCASPESSAFGAAASAPLPGVAQAGRSGLIREATRWTVQPGGVRPNSSKNRRASANQSSGSSRPSARPSRQFDSIQSTSVLSVKSRSR